MSNFKPTSNSFFNTIKALNIRDFSNHLVLVFHHDDMDGAVAAASVYFSIKLHEFSPEQNEYKKKLLENITFIPVNYDRQNDKDLLKYVDINTSVFVLDFAFTPELTQEMINTSLFFQTLDHHETSERMLGNSEHVYFDSTSSGALMAFQYFFPNEEDIPLAVTLADNRDLWKKDHGDEDAFHEALMATRSQSKDNQEFIKYLVDIVFDPVLTDEMIKYGNSMIDKRDSNIKLATAKRNLIKIDFAGYPAIFFNYSVDQSDACEFLYSQPEYSNYIVGTFKFLSNGLVNFSLRKGKYCGANLAKIAEYNFGGGGHEQAAGFHCTYERAISIISGKEKWAMCWLAEEVDAILANDSHEMNKLGQLLRLNPFMISRTVCETDKRFLQVLPYVTVNDGQGNYLSYERPVTGNEGRLHGMKSVGFGGHVEQLPVTSNMSIHLTDEAIRELTEELGINNDLVNYNQLFNAIMNKDFKVIRMTDTDTEAVHLGLLLDFKVNSEEVKAQPDEIAGLQWKPITDLNKQVCENPEDFERWSRVAIKELSSNRKRGESPCLIIYD